MLRGRLLDDTRSGDAGLAAIAGLTQPGWLHLGFSRIRRSWGAALRAALPGCPIPWH